MISKPAGAVAAGHPKTTEVASIILREGGNAFDAAIGAMCAACMAEPVLASLGGGGFFLTRTADGRSRLYDCFVQTPVQRRDLESIEFYPVTVDFGTVCQEFHIGAGSTATPGMVRGLFEVHRELGYMPFTRIVEPALELARQGCIVSDDQAFILGLVQPIFTATESARKIFARSSASEELIGAGHSLRIPEWADALESLARQGDVLFYEGEIAQAIIEDSRQGGGHLRHDDLRNYKVACREPLRFDYRGHRVSTNPPPSSGGILIAFALGLLAGESLGGMECFGPDHWSLLARSMALTNEARIASENQDGNDDNTLLDSGMLEQYRNDIAGRPAARRGTTHISVIDAAGNVAGLSVSNGEGNGRIIAGTGLMLNNMLGEQDLNPAGFHQWHADCRMTSMMAPTLIESQGPDILTVMGSGGSNRIRSAMQQVIVNLLDFNLPIDDAVHAPRLHCEDGFLNIEMGDPELLQPLLHQWPDHKIWNSRNMFFGGTHCVRYDGAGFTGSGDPRRGGVFELS